jgi:hypothetical protein
MSARSEVAELTPEEIVIMSESGVCLNVVPSGNSDLVSSIIRLIIL